MGKLFGVKKTSIGGGSSGRGSAQRENSAGRSQNDSGRRDSEGDRPEERPAAGVSTKPKTIKGGKAKEKFVMAESFKQQAPMGDIDLSGRSK